MRPNGGKRVAYTYTLGGVDFDGHVEAVEYEPESQITLENLRSRLEDDATPAEQPHPSRR